MRVLAIDTALAACAAGVFDAAAGELVAHESLPMTRGHAEALMPLIASVMARCGLDFSELDRVAVTTGPGSFTGLRVGIAAARGIALAAGKPAVGVSTLSAYAVPHLAEAGKTPVVSAIDARHSHVYLQVFAPGGRVVTGPRLAGLDEAVRAAGETAARIVGSAAHLVAERLGGAAAKPVCVEQSDAVDIGWVARLGAVLPQAESPPKPLYLRAADARPQTAGQLPRR